MNEQDRSIFELLAMTIFADKQIYASEIQAFTWFILELQANGVLVTEFSEAKIVLWYELNKERLQALNNHEDFETWLVGTLSLLSSVPEKEKIIEAIETISKSDNDEHISEKALKTLASRIWSFG